MRLICCFYCRWNVQICLMGGESRRTFLSVFKRPIRRLRLSLWEAQTHHLRSLAEKSAAPLLRCKSVTDMRGRAGKLDLKRKRTGQGPQFFKAQTQTRRTTTRSHQVSFHDESKQSGSKWEGAKHSCKKKEKKSEIIWSTTQRQRGIIAFGMLTKRIR